MTSKGNQSGPYQKRDGGRIHQFLLSQQSQGKIELSDPKETLKQLSSSESSIPQGSFTGKVLDGDESHLETFFTDPSQYIEASRHMVSLRGPHVSDTRWTEGLDDFRERLVPEYPSSQLYNRPRISDKYMQSSSYKPNQYSDGIILGRTLQNPGSSSD